MKSPGNDRGRDGDAADLSAEMADARQVAPGVPQLGDQCADPREEIYHPGGQTLRWSGFGRMSQVAGGQWRTLMGSLLNALTHSIAPRKTS